MGKKLTNAPVYYTVAQVQFNPVLDMDGYIPSIQSKLREAHFPDYKKEVFQQLVLPFGGAEQGQMVAPSLTPQSRYLFGDIDGRSLFLLETNALSFQTTSYDTFETFSATFLKGLGILNDALGLNFVERIGLRYLDAVQPSKRCGNSLCRKFWGFRCEMAVNSSNPSARLSSRLPLGSLCRVSSSVMGMLVFPWNWAVWPPSSTLDLPSEMGCMTHRETFELSKVGARLTSLHDEIEKSFNATVTDHARASWA